MRKRTWRSQMPHQTSIMTPSTPESFSVANWTSRSFARCVGLRARHPLRCGSRPDTQTLCYARFTHNLSSLPMTLPSAIVAKGNPDKR